MWIGIIAGIIGIFNFIYSVSFGLPGPQMVMPTIPNVDLLIRILFLFLLESALAYSFGYILTKINKMGKVLPGEGLPLILLILVALLSAWTSLFNIQWFLIGPPPIFSEIASSKSKLYISKFFIFGLLTYIWAIYFIAFHSIRDFTSRYRLFGQLDGPFWKNINKIDVRCVIVQGILFFLIGIYFLKK